MKSPTPLVSYLHEYKLFECLIVIAVKSKAANYCKSIRPLDCFLNRIPLLRWLPEYSWKKSLLSDIISGITVAVMHIPQVLKKLEKYTYHTQ